MLKRELEQRITALLDERVQLRVEAKHTTQRLNDFEREAKKATEALECVTQDLERARHTVECHAATKYPRDDLPFSTTITTAPDEGLNFLRHLATILGTNI